VTNESQISPFPEFRLFGVTGAFFPSRARWRGRTCSLNAAADRVYADGFQHDMAGVAEMHSPISISAPRRACNRRS